MGNGVAGIATNTRRARRRLLNRRYSRLAATGANARRSLPYDAIKRVLNAVSE